MDASQLTASAALVVAVGGALTPWLSAWLKSRTDARQADTEEEKTAVESYRVLVADMRAENERLHRYVTDLQTENLRFKGYVGRLEICLDRAADIIRSNGGVPPERPTFNGAGNA